MNISKFYTSKDRFISVFYKGKYSTSFINAVEDLQELFKHTILLPVNASLQERIYCYINGVKFRPKCLMCNNDVTFFKHEKRYKRYCSDSCASKDRSSFYIIDELTRERISQKSKETNYNRNMKLLEEWKQIIFQNKPNLDFSKFDWQPYKNHVSTVICKKHGERQLSIQYLKSSPVLGCDLCGQEVKGYKISILKRNTGSHDVAYRRFYNHMKQNRIEIFNQINWDDFIYTDRSQKISFECSVHGKTEATIQYLMKSKYECPQCGSSAGASSSPLNIQILKNYVSNAFNHVRIISDVYTNVFDRNIQIECDKHGVSTTNADMLLRSKFICKQCGRDAHSEQKSYSLDDVNKQLSFKHPHITCTFYTRSGNRDSKFVCDKHGEFIHSYALVIGSDYGCPDCVPNGYSRGEHEVRDFIKDLGFNPKTDRSFGWHIDSLVREKNFGIEYNGMRYHSDSVRPDKNYHKTKTDTCRSNGIFLLHIWECDWEDPVKQEILKSMIRTKLGVVETKIHARKCQIVDLSDNSKLVQSFLEQNHIQGRTGTKVAYGLMYDDQLVSVMTFSILNGVWNLSRFANKTNTIVNGAFSKLLKHFEIEHNPKQIDTFADLTYSYGDVYRNNGFNEISESGPGYFYFYRDKKYHRSSFMKDKIAEKFNLSKEYVDGKTETELVDEFGIFRIWDSGKIKFSKLFN